MISAFWDASGLVPLCVEQKTTARLLALRRTYSVVVWWATSVEVISAFERLLRTREMSSELYVTAAMRLEQLGQSWQEIHASDGVKAKAEKLLGQYPLKAADALQLAAAWTWASGEPAGHCFISGDGQLLRAARYVGFETLVAE